MNRYINKDFFIEIESKNIDRNRTYKKPIVDLVSTIQGYFNAGLLIAPVNITPTYPYTFQNGITQAPLGIVELGGSLIKNTTIDGNNNFGILLNDLVGFSIGAIGIDTLSNYIRSIALDGITFTTNTLELQTPSITGGSAINGQVLTLIDATTGESEWQPVPSLIYQNGLTKTSNIVELGGNLLHNTEINGVLNAYHMQFRDINSFTVTSSNMDVYADDIMYVKGANTTIKGTSTLILDTPNIQNTLGSLGQVFTLIDPLTGSGEWQTITFPTDIFLQSGIFNSTTNELELTLNDSTQINIPMSALVPVSTDSTLSGNGTLATPLSIAKQGAAVEDVLTWNGTTWIPQPIPSICEQLELVPNGTYSQGIKVLSHGGTVIPSTWVGYEFDYPSLFGACSFSTNIADFYFVDFQHCGQSTSEDPISVIDQLAVQTFIDNVLIPDLIVCGYSVSVGDIIYTVNGTTIVVWYNPAYNPTNNNWVFSDVTGGRCEKQSPSIPTSLSPQTGGCSLITLPTKITEYFDLYSGSAVTLTNTPVFIYGVYRNGVFQREGASRDYIVSGSIITFNIPLVNDDISIVYEY